ncbi:alpha/beta hydrolase related protein [Melioribacter roseus P3M-2]|uniref:Alpha/beta hydrolase related protein n=1 Tax=Melioribacter roseus (strain DSM 23840 / JCM 17771 / VKM B-2668 / P3M-2) TaxID=1191523 RepID=I7A0Q6_MELRP|nr:prolyl oligopeptidase family serine peptidase [Melioribacter roseus]AFN74828.1 alpha/beta hydrolase related protein [Melioribacter roseus P3M-2]
MKIRAFLSVLTLLLALLTVSAQQSDTILIKDGLAVSMDYSYRDNVITPDPIVASIVTGSWKEPTTGQKVKKGDKLIGEWKEIDSDENGWFKAPELRNGYVYMKFNSDKNRIVLLEAMGHSFVFINGTMRSGNPYRTKDTYESWEPRFDYSLIPVEIKKGVNHLVFRCNRSGALKVKIHQNTPPILFSEEDLTIPDLIVNKPASSYGAILLINAGKSKLNNLYIKTYSDNSAIKNIPAYSKLPVINPLSVYKAPFKIELPEVNKKEAVRLNIELVEKSTGVEKTLLSEQIELKVVDEYETRRETFVSKLDGSVQYYAVNPPIDLKNKPALFLSLHGAGVEAINQANSYGHKNWGYIVSPTNRRPYGFNWENWGRVDALEVMEIALKKFNIDRERVYLTGHSMGGHGTWQLGINYPDRFAAIGPSAGWISIWSYRIRNLIDTSDVKEMLVRSSKQSDTYEFARNLVKNGIYVIHGDADDNVPISQAESMLEIVSKFHKDYEFHIEKGAGHWWDNSDEDGADCVDWMPMFDFFARHSAPKKHMIRNVEFTTANPAVSSKYFWIEIINQEKQQKLSKVNFTLEYGKRVIKGKTENVSYLAFDLSVLNPGAPVSVEIDGRKIENIPIPSDYKLFLCKNDGVWEITGKPAAESKNPLRLGNIREVLNNNVLFVYGTHGSKDENKWAFEKSRFDAEYLWYQGNAAIEVIEDDQFDPLVYKDRNVVLYGNAETNSAWNKLLKDSPVNVEKGKIKIGDKIFYGKDLSCLMIRPRRDSDIASVAVLAGAGIKGMKLAELAQFYHPYLSFPDLVVYDSKIIESDDQGVRFIGYFGNDWSIEKGEFINKF